MKGQQVAACKEITRLIPLQRQLFIHVGVFGCVLAINTHSVDRKMTSAQEPYDSLSTLETQSFLHRQLHPSVCPTAESQTPHYLLQPDWAVLRDNKGNVLLVTRRYICSLYDKGKRAALSYANCELPTALCTSHKA
ncbi:hypothetical protein XENOCAPTIV_002897 [Xenoophorus captivus]|uniref:Uncharacterized protein n=1 Tax=Xenoophorus captivus TaxID=1517983 RepID=A0ABV0RLR0_9TELE